MTEFPIRRIRSFVRREGRLTAGQERALQHLWPLYGLEADGRQLILSRIYGRQAPVTLEIGFGNGESLATMAAANPTENFLGIEVHRPGVGHLLQEIEGRGLNNLRVMCHDAVEVLESQIQDDALDRVLLFFPDPWHKKKHHKRRILQTTFIDLLARKLRPGGLFHMATDWQDYAEHMLAEMEQAAAFRNLAGKGQYAEKPHYRPTTKFERRGQRLGHGVWDLLYQRRQPLTPHP